MYRKDAVGLLWSTFFNAEKDKKETIKSLKPLKAENYNPDILLRFFDYRKMGIEDKEVFIGACEAAVLEYCLKISHFAEDVLDEKDYEKALDLYKRKQFTGVLKELLAKFCVLCSGTSYEKTERLNLLLELDIQRCYDTLISEKANKSFAELKKKLESIASGVKNDCYFAAEEEHYLPKLLNDELNDFLKKKYGYDLNSIKGYDQEGVSAIIYRRALLDSKEFWRKHTNFSVFVFIDSIYSLNGAKHAQKVLSYIFDTIKSDETGAKLIEKNLAFYYLFKDKILGMIKENTFNLAFRRFVGVYDLSKIRFVELCYPLIGSNGVEENIVNGKAIIDGLLAEVYPADKERVLQFFNGQLTGKDETFYLNNRYCVRDMFVGNTFGYWLRGEDFNKAVEVYCPEYFSAENMWNRIYLIADAASKLEKNTRKCYANLFEIFYDLFNAVEKKFGLKTSFQRNTEGREQAYIQLKETLKSYGVEISDEFKNDYIISLLDRKVSVMEESARFPVLEQLGDAVYGLAVAEMMFYQPTGWEEESIFFDYDDYVCADAQVKIAHMLGIDKLYISPLTLSYKYTRDTVVNPDTEIFVLRQELADNHKYKFLADTLEMIIGTICKDCGYEKAIEFTKKIVKEKYPEVFGEELRFGLEMDVPKMEIDCEYWNRIMPSPLPEFESYRSKELLNKMWEALNKFMLAYSLGTDDVGKRKFITNHHNGDELYGKNRLGNYYINYALYEYLHNGLAYTVKKYLPRLQTNYKNLNKQN